MTQEQLLEGTVIAIDKPYQWTSFQVVNKIKSAIRHTFDLKKFKIGHAGTLDPLATGVLLVCVGKATKRIDELQNGEKVYSGTMILGATTPCYDLERAIDHYYPYQHITTELISEKVQQFVGLIDQVPPIFSAVKIDGQRAYSYAREAKEGEEIPSPTPKQVLVKEFEITGFRPGKPLVKGAEGLFEPEKSIDSIDYIESIDPIDSIDSIDSTEPTNIINPQKSKNLSSAPLTHLYNNPLGIVPEHLPQLNFRIRCGKGTYIRSLARDLGLALDSGAFLSSLRREQVGDYSLADTIKLDDIQDFLEA